MSSTDEDAVCVIVINYFALEHTARCLRALNGEVFSKLYLVDNSADARQAQSCRDLLTELQEQGATFDCEFIANLHNLGFGRAINSVLAHDRGAHRYGLLLNNDAFVGSGTVAGLTRALREHPDAALASAQMMEHDKPVPLLGYHRWSGHVSGSGSGFRYASGACLLADVARLAPGGQLLDPDFFMYGEDVELNWRCQREGWRMTLVEDAQVSHIGNASTRDRPLFYEYHVARGHLLLAHKLRTSLPAYWLALLGRATYLPARALVRALRMRSWVPLHGTLRAFLGAAPPD